MKPNSFQNGDVFALKLDDEFGGGYACVVVLRKAIRGRKVILAGIPRRWSKWPTADDVQDMLPGDQVVIGLCVSNDELRNGTWRRLGPLRDFSHDIWPTPATYDAGWVATLATPDTWWYSMPVEKIDVPRKIRSLLLHRLDMPHVLAEAMPFRIGRVLAQKSTPHWDWRYAVQPYTPEHRAAWAFVNELMSQPVRRYYSRRRSK